MSANEPIRLGYVKSNGNAKSILQYLTIYTSTSSTSLLKTNSVICADINIGTCLKNPLQQVSTQLYNGISNSIGVELEKKL